MKTRKAILRRRMAELCTAAFATLLAVGCVTATPQADRMALSLERDLAGIHFEPQHGFKLGRISMGLARTVARMALDEDEEREAVGLFKGVRRVEVSSYLASGSAADRAPNRVEQAFLRGGWQTLARYRQEGDLAWVLYRFDKEVLRNVVVIALDDEELMIVRLSGRLDRVVEAALDFARQEVSRKRDADGLEEVSPADARPEEDRADDWEDVGDEPQTEPTGVSSADLGELIAGWSAPESPS